MLYYSLITISRAALADASLARGQRWISLLQLACHAAEHERDVCACGKVAQVSRLARSRRDKVPLASYSPLGAFRVAEIGFWIISSAMRISSCSIDSSARSSLSGRRVIRFKPGILGMLGMLESPFCRYTLIKSVLSVVS